MPMYSYIFAFDAAAVDVRVFETQTVDCGSR
jgi:hypothetical protein